MTFETHGTLAAELEKSAVEVLTAGTEELERALPDLTPAMKAQQLVAMAQARATIAASLRTADLTSALEVELAGIRRELRDQLLEALGDDSHLDGIKREIRDGLDAIRVDGIGVG